MVSPARAARRPLRPGPVLQIPRPPPSGLLGRAVHRLRSIVWLPRKIAPTREGWVFSLLTLAVAAAALNTGNNLLYMLLSLMLGMIAVSGVLSENAIRRLRVERALPRALTAGRDATGRLTVHNPRRWMPHVAVTVVEERGGQCDGGASPGSFAVVPPRSAASVPVTYRFGRRGRHRLAGFRVSTTYPFGLIRKWYRVEQPVDVLVYPRMGRPVSRAAPPDPGDGERAARHAGFDGEFFGLRDVVDGEDARRIHWKISARRGSLVAVEHSLTDRETVSVYLLPGGDPDRRELAVDRFERAVEDAAATVALLLDAGHEVGLVTPAGAIPPADGPGQRRRILAHLAVLPVPDEPLEGDLLTLRRRLGGRDVAVA